MEQEPPLRLVCSDDLGLLKVVQTPDGARLDAASVVATWGQPEKERAVTSLALSSRGGLADAETAVLATGRASGAIDVLNPCTSELLASIPASEAPANGGSSHTAEAAAVRGLHWAWSGGAAESAAAARVLLSVTQGGAARVHGAGPAGDESSSWEQLRTWQVPADVCCTAYDAGSGMLAVGCQGAELRLFDAAAGQLTYTAKGGKPNKVGLVDRPWNTALAFLPDAARLGGEGGAGGLGHVVLAGTGYHKLRLYDTRAGKRPQAELAFGEARITALAPEPDGLRCWVGTGLGQLEVLDLRALKMAGGIRGIAGSVRALAVHPGRPVLASLGLDRFLRLHDTRSRQPLGKVYLKSQLSGVQFCPLSADMLPPPAEVREGAEVEGAEGGGSQGVAEGRRAAKKKEKRRKEGSSSREKREKKAKAAE